MTRPASLKLDLGWPSGRSGPAGIALQVASRSTNDLSRFLVLFLLEGAHWTCNGFVPVT